MVNTLEILYVERSSSAREMVHSALKGLDVEYRVTHVTSRADIEEKLGQSDYAVVISSFAVTGFEDFQIIDFMRAKNPHVSVIIIEPAGSEEVVVECMKRGASDFLLNTEHTLRKLPYAIEAALEKSRLRVERERMTQQLSYQAQLLAQVNDAIIATDENMILTAWNHAAEQMYGWEAAEVLGRNVFGVLRSELSDSQRKDAMRALSQVGHSRRELIQYSRDGKAIYVEASSIKLHDVEGGISGYVTVARDITERKQAEEKIRQSQRHYERTAANVPGVVYQWLLKTDGTVEWPYISEGSLELTGKDPQFIQENPNWLINSVHSEDRPQLDRSIEEAVTTLCPWAWEGRFVLPGGETKWVQGVSRPEKQENGDVLADGLFLDITERKQAESALRASEKQFSTAFRQAAVGAALVAPDGRYLKVNPALCQMLGYSEADLLTRTYQSITHPEDLTDVNIQRLMNGTLDTIQIEKRYFHRQGHVVWALLSAAMVRDEAGQPHHQIAQIQDITERKSLEQALEKSHREIVNIFESIAEAFYAVDREWNFTYVNAAGYQLHNRESGSLIGKNLWEEFPEALGTVFQEQYDQAMDERVPVTFDAYYEPIDKVCEMRAYPFDDGISIFCRDVTEQRRNEAMLREMESRFRRLANANIVGICISGIDGIFYEVNDFFLNLLGYSRREFQEKPFHWDTLTPPEYAALDARAIEELLETGALTPFEKEYICKDGSRVPVLIAGTALQETPGRGLVLVLDLTWQKQAERDLKAYAAKLERSNRELQEFAYIASHDLQEPLRKIEAFSGQLEEDYSAVLGETGKDSLRRMCSAVQRMRAFITDLLTLSRVESNSQPMEPVDLQQVAREVLSDLETQIKGSGAHIDVAVLPTIEADPLQMRQLLQNLIGNALKFHRDTAAPRVQVQCQQISESGAIGAEIFQLCVVDNGIGFDEKHLERVFQPFVRLHGRSKFEGSGMGLALCRKIVERHGGHITAKSVLGQGSTFIVTLPGRQPQIPQPNELPEGASAA